MQTLDIDYINKLDLETQLKIFNQLIENLGVCSVEKASEILIISKTALYKKQLIKIDKIKLVPVNILINNQCQKR